MFNRIIHCRVYLHLDRNLPNRARNQSKRDRQLSNCFLRSRMLIVNHMVQHEHLDLHDFSPKNKVIRNLNQNFFHSQDKFDYQSVKSGMRGREQRGCKVCSDSFERKCND